MCAPHQATLMEDCSDREAVLLLGIAGFNANPEFLDLYLRASSPSVVSGDLTKLAQSRHELRNTFLSYPDTPEGGREALDTLRQFLGGKAVCKGLPIAEEAPKKSCCH
jgi:hypothetical protein